MVAVMLIECENKRSENGRWLKEVARKCKASSSKLENENTLNVQAKRALFAVVFLRFLADVLHVSPFLPYL